MHRAIPLDSGGLESQQAGPHESVITPRDFVEAAEALWLPMPLAEPALK